MEIKPRQGARDGDVGVQEMSFKDPEKRREYAARWAREWRAKNPGKSAAYQRTLRSYKARWARQNRADNREKHRAQKRAQYRRNRVAHLERSRKWREANRDKHLAGVRIWKLKNPEKVRWTRKQTKHKRRAREGKFYVSDIRALFAKQDGLCVVCGTSLAEYFEVDHIVSIARGGTNWPSNLQLLCRHCNRKKGAN